MDKNNAVAVSIANPYTYYDLLALLCYSIHELEQDVQNNLAMYASSHFSQYINEANELIQRLFPKSSSVISGYSSLNWNVFTLLSAMLDNRKDLHGWAVILGLISLIDTKLPIDKNFVTFLEGRNCKVLDDEHAGVSESYYEFKALNCKTKDQYGLILPNLHCEWSKETSRTMDAVSFNPLSFALNNHIWVCKNDRWHITNLYCDFRNTGFNKARIEKEEPFKIVFSPLSKQAPFIINLNKETNLFYVHYLPQYNAILMERLRRIIDYAIKDKADIVVFPEMMGNDVCIQFCREYISMAFSEWRPKLFLLPSWEHEENGKWYNTLYALDRNGDCIFKYNKQHAFCLDKNTPDGTEIVKYFEPIEADGNVYIVHVPGIGRIGMIICADAFEEGYLVRLVKELKITLLLYPTFTFGKDLMKRVIKYAEVFSCDVIFCNTCAAWDDALEPPENRKENNSFDSEFVGFYHPAGHKNYEEAAMKKLPFADCKGSVCQGCLFVTKLAKKYNTQFVASQQIRLEEA